MAEQSWEHFRIPESPGPDYFLPEVFTLASGTVQGVETSPSDPKVRMDSTGIYITESNGKKPVALDAAGYLRLLAITGAPNLKSRSISWVNDDLTGGLLARIGGLNYGPDQTEAFFELQTQTASVGKAELRVIDKDGTTKQASVSANYTDGGLAQVIAQAGTKGVKIIDSDGNTDLLVASHGTGNLNFPGSAFSDPLVINHGLGVAPRRVLALASAPSFNIGDAVVINVVSGLSSTNFSLRGRTVSGAAVGPGAITIWWVAIK